MIVSVGLSPLSSLDRFVGQQSIMVGCFAVSAQRGVLGFFVLEVCLVQQKNKNLF
jgi:hypothetical protein